MRTDVYGVPVLAVTATQFYRAAERVFKLYPQAVLVKNKVGNLSIMNNGVYVGFIDLVSGDVEVLE